MTRRSVCLGSIGKIPLVVCSLLFLVLSLPSYLSAAPAEEVDSASTNIPIAPPIEHETLNLDGTALQVNWNKDKKLDNLEQSRSTTTRPTTAFTFVMITAAIIFCYIGFRALHARREELASARAKETGLQSLHIEPTNTVDRIYRVKRE